MKKISGNLLVAWLYVCSWFPLWYLYVWSGFLFLLMYYVVGYRKKIVRTNLKNSFPEKSEQERKQLEKKFYRYMCDLIVETLKIPTISQNQIKKRCMISPENVRLIEHYYNTYKAVIGVLGHHGNYEWANLAMATQTRCDFYGVYHPLSNKSMDNFLKNTRGRLGTKLITMKKAYVTLRSVVESGKQFGVFGLISDQSPSPKNAYWTTFLNQETGVFRGPEHMARKYNIPVIFGTIKKIKRGHYELIPELLCENPAALQEGALTELHVRKLEQVIREQPETWLWSHRRWKHKKPV